MNPSLRFRSIGQSFTSQNPYPLDWKLFLILIPITAAINHYLTYSSHELNWYLITTFTIDSLQGYIAWLAVRVFIFWLDRAHPYEKNFGKRIGIQLLGSFVIGLGIISLLTEVVCWIVKGHWVPMDFYLFDLPIISIWFFGLNGVYVVYYYYNLTLGVEETAHDKIPQPTGLRISHGKKEIWMGWDELAGFSVEGEYVRVQDIEGSNYYIDQSLSQLERLLPPTDFFRLNRQHILHRQAISGFQRQEGGKLCVLTKAPLEFEDAPSVSKKKAPVFKQWFRQE